MSTDNTTQTQGTFQQESSAPTTIHLVRHGEVHNPDKVLYGRIPGFGLSALGKEMAEGIAEYFSSDFDPQNPAARISAIYSSPLERAQQTSQPLADQLGLPIRTDQRLIEAENHFEGLKGIKSELKNPKHWPYLINPFKPSWGESYKQQVARMKHAMQAARDEVHREFPESQMNHIVMVSHQLPIWVTRLDGEDRRLYHDPRKRECSLTSVTSFEYLDGVLSNIRYHEPNAHLAASAANLPGA